MKITKPVVNESIASVTRRLETLELESYMQAFSEFMESPLRVEDANDIKHLLDSLIRRWRRLNDDDKFRTFGFTLAVAKFLSLHTAADLRKAVREFSAIVYETRDIEPGEIRPQPGPATAIIQSNSTNRNLDESRRVQVHQTERSFSTIEKGSVKLSAGRRRR